MDTKNWLKKTSTSKWSLQISVIRRITSSYDWWPMTYHHHKHGENSITHHHGYSRNQHKRLRKQIALRKSVNMGNRRYVNGSDWLADFKVNYHASIRNWLKTNPNTYHIPFQLVALFGVASSQDVILSKMSSCHQATLPIILWIDRATELAQKNVNLTG